MVDLDATDDTVEVFAAEFFAQRLTMHSLKWDVAKAMPYVVQREVLSDIYVHTFRYIWDVAKAMPYVVQREVLSDVLYMCMYVCMDVYIQREVLSDVLSALHSQSSVLLY